MVDYVFTKNLDSKSLPFSEQDILAACKNTNEYLTQLPDFFGTTSYNFYSTLNQRNLSGFIGEVFKHALCAINKKLIPNPHPDGRPDVLGLFSEEIEIFYKSCFDGKSGAPLREYLAPFKYGGVEIKCTIGNTPKAGSFDIGDPRAHKISGLNYWAHHAHACDLLGIYYDYCESTNGNPQIKGVLFCPVLESDWHEVSVGRPDRKKTSNTSLNKQGVQKLKRSLFMHSSEEKYVNNLSRIGYIKN